MIKYAVLYLFHERLGRKWTLLCDIVQQDIEDVKVAEKIRMDFLNDYPLANVQNVQVHSYSTVS